MQLPKIKCCNARPENRERTEENSFYVLCKGENAGKPLRKPCANCFIVTCSSADESEYWFWLTWGLWTSKRFHYYLRGSVIPFIRLCDYQVELIESSLTAIEKPDLFDKALKTMRSIEKYEQDTQRKLALLAQIKISLFQKVLKRA